MSITPDSSDFHLMAKLFDPAEGQRKAAPKTIGKDNVGWEHRLQSNAFQVMNPEDFL